MGGEIRRTDVMVGDENLQEKDAIGMEDMAKKEPAITGEPVSKEDLESARHLLESENEQKSTMKSSIIEDYRLAQEDWNNYKEAKELLISVKKSPEQLREKQKKMVKELGDIDLKLAQSDKARSESKNVLGKLKRFFSPEAPAILSKEKKKEAEEKAEELKRQIADLKDRIIRVSTADHFLNTHDELKLKNQAEKSKLEAERH